MANQKNQSKSHLGPLAKLQEAGIAHPTLAPSMPAPLAFPGPASYGNRSKFPRDPLRVTMQHEWHPDEEKFRLMAIFKADSDGRMNAALKKAQADERAYEEDLSRHKIAEKSHDGVDLLTWNGLEADNRPPEAEEDLDNYFTKHGGSKDDAIPQELSKILADAGWRYDPWEANWVKLNEISGRADVYASKYARTPNWKRYREWHDARLDEDEARLALDGPENKVDVTDLGRRSNHDEADKDIEPVIPPVPATNDARVKNDAKTSKTDNTLKRKADEDDTKSTKLRIVLNGKGNQQAGPSKITLKFRNTQNDLPKPQNDVSKQQKDNPKQQRDVAKHQKNVPKQQEKVPNPQKDVQKPQKSVRKPQKGARKPRTKSPSNGMHYIQEEKDFVQDMLEADTKGELTWADILDQFNIHWDGYKETVDSPPRPPRSLQGLQELCRGELLAARTAWIARKQQNQSSKAGK